MLTYNSTTIKFYNFIITHPENKVIDKSTFLTNNTDVSIPKREKISRPKKKMSTYLEINLLTYLPRIIINQSLSIFPTNKDVGIPFFKESSVPYNFHHRILSNKSPNSSIVKDQILTNNKDVGIPRKKISISKKRCRHTYVNNII